MNIVVKRALQIGGATGWFGVAFGLSWWLTFPSAAVGDFVKYQVQESGKYALDLEDVAPSGLGLRLDGVSLYAVEKRRGKSAAEPKTTLMFEADAVRVKVGGPWSLIALVTGGDATIKGSVTRAGGDVDFRTTLAATDEGRRELRSVEVTGDGVPLNAISAGYLEGDGGVDVDISLDAPDGVSQADGTITFTSDDAVIRSIVAEQLEGLDFGAIQVSELDVQFEVTDGRAKVTTGRIVSDLAQIEVSGDIILADDITSSRLRLKLILELSDTLAPMKGFLKTAEWADGGFHYALSGTLAKPRPRPERERKSRGVERLGGEDGGPDDIVDFPRDPGPDDGAGPPDPENRKERARRRAEAIEERRRRADEMRQDGVEEPARRPGHEVGPPPGEEQPPPDEHPFPPDEPPPPLPDEDPLPPQDDLPPYDGGGDE
jgi:type II secretion system protein N